MSLKWGVESVDRFKRTRKPSTNSPTACFYFHQLILWHNPTLSTAMKPWWKIPRNFLLTPQKELKYWFDIELENFSAKFAISSWKKVAFRESQSSPFHALARGTETNRLLILARVTKKFPAKRCLHKVLPQAVQMEAAQGRGRQRPTNDVERSAHRQPRTRTCVVLFIEFYLLFFTATLGIYFSVTYYTMNGMVLA
ncbi:hypothetical protein R5R35_004512 [Gryllus longicercus]|uniref:Uncharacterized protein n=1 Tax=Gryllus longicercus TaxID=2509291 RepID=A0AAN9V8L1_9ORTH